MIPKIIHYCWFGGGEKSELIKHCMESWRKYLPDYEFIEWNETRNEIMGNRFVQSALAKRKFAFASDFARAYALYHFGGVYLDTDVEIKGSLDEFLVHDAVSGFEKPGLAITALWGSVAEHPWPQKVLQYYADRTYDENEPPNTESITNIVSTEFGIDSSRDEFQLGKHGVAIYPSSTFCLDLPKTVACHHFDGSWLPKGHRPYKQVIHRDYYLRQYLASTPNGNIDELADHLVSQKLFTTRLFFAIVNSYKRKAIARVKQRLGIAGY